MIVNLPTKGIFKWHQNNKFYPQDGGETSWHRYRTKLRHCHSMYTKNNLYEAVCETSLAPSCMDRPTFGSIYLFIYLFIFLNCNQQFANFKRNQFPSAVR